VPFPLTTTAVDGTTVLNKAYIDAFVTEINAALVDLGHPTVTPGQAIAELIAARGSRASVDARLLTVVDHDGNPLSQLSPRMTRNGFVWGNCAWNAGHVLWSRGDAAAPDGWTVSGAGVAIARCGFGQADTNVFNASDHANFAARLTYGSAIARYTHQFAPTQVFQATDNGIWEGERAPLDANGDPLPGYASVEENTQMYVLAAVMANGVNRARISIGDQAGIGNLSYSNYHPGDGGFHWLLAGPFDATNAPSTLNIQGHCENAGTAYFMDWMICLSSIGLSPTFLPEKPIKDFITLQSANNPASATGLFYWSPNEPIIITGVRLGCSAAPTTTAPTVDLLTPIGGAYASMFATLPDIPVTKFTGVQATDPASANYRRKCIRGIQTDGAAALADNSIVRIDYVDDGGNTLRDLVITIDFLRFPRPFEQWRSLLDIGE
jgi:hypothetical protein